MKDDVKGSRSVLPTARTEVQNAIYEIESVQQRESVLRAGETRRRKDIDCSRTVGAGARGRVEPRAVLDGTFDFDTGGREAVVAINNAYKTFDIKKRST